MALTLKIIGVWLLLSIGATLLRSWFLHLKYGPPS